MPVPTNYISGGTWRGLIGLLYWRRDIIRGWRDLERSVQSSYISGEILRCLFKAIILVERYNKGVERAVPCSYISGESWRELFRAFITGEGSRDAYSNQLY